MKFQKELFVMLSKSLSTDIILDGLEKSISNYRECKLLNKNEKEALHELQLATHMFILHSMDKEGEEIIKEMKKVEHRVGLFETTKN